MIGWDIWDEIMVWWVQQTDDKIKSSSSTRLERPEYHMHSQLEATEDTVINDGKNEYLFRFGCGYDVQLPAGISRSNGKLKRLRTIGNLRT
jgi:hypothetical protein